MEEIRRESMIMRGRSGCIVEDLFDILYEVEGFWGRSMMPGIDEVVKGAKARRHLQGKTIADASSFAQSL